MFETSESLSLNKIQVLFLRKHFNLPNNFDLSPNMGGKDRNTRSNLIQVKLEGRSNPTIKGKRNNIVSIPRNVPIRYTVEELRKIRGDVEYTAKHKILGAETSYRIRKLRLNK